MTHKKNHKTSLIGSKERRIAGLFCYTKIIMKISIITVGSPKLSFAKDGIAEYLKRVQKFASVEFVHIKEGKDTDKKVLKAVGGSFCVLLDEQGKEYTSGELAMFLDKKDQQSVTNISFVVGGPDGHTGAIYERGEMQLALSRLTLPHDLAMLFVIETLYRSLSISNNHPYHRN